MALPLVPVLSWGVMRRMKINRKEEELVPQQARQVLGFVGGTACGYHVHHGLSFRNIPHHQMIPVDMAECAGLGTFLGTAGILRAPPTSGSVPH